MIIGLLQGSPKLDWTIRSLSSVETVPVHTIDVLLVGVICLVRCFSYPRRYSFLCMQSLLQHLAQYFLQPVQTFSPLARKGGLDCLLAKGVF